MMTRVRRWHWGAAAIAAALVPVALACSDVPTAKDTVTVNGPSLADFAGAGGVSAVIERNCGSLDCHGNDARALRIYSQYGLRKPPGLVTTFEPTDAGPDAAPEEEEEETSDAGPPSPGTEPTTPEEVLANYQSVISLEPRIMQAVVKGADPYKLLLLKKPLQIERHKGGPALSKGREAETCIVGWLKSKVDKNACLAASQLP
jgi:hypothetical protein